MNITLALQPIRYQFHPEVWVMMIGLIGAYIYMVRVVGPKAVGPGGTVVTRRQVICFVLAMVLLWIASDFPVHDIGEDYLYSVHMVQHMVISFFVPPLALLATPTWLARLIIGKGAAYRFFKWLTNPVVAFIVFNSVVIALHLPAAVDYSVNNGEFHYLMHLAVMVTSLIMWAPVCGPIPEFRIGPAKSMVYLFFQSLIPTVPAGWLTFAETPVYPVYDRPIRLWGLSLVDDQQLAGGIMKIGGGLFLWGVIIYLFFAKFVPASNEPDSVDDEPRASHGDGDGDGDDVLTTADVERAFGSSNPVTERHPTP